MLTGYLQTLPTDVLLNMGVLFYSRNGVATRLGVTEGAPDFDPGVELQDIEFDGKRCRLKAQTRRVGFKPVIKGTIKEFGSVYSGNQLALLETGETEPPAAPGQPVLTPSTTGGTLVAGTYYYKISALNAAGESVASPENSCVTTGTTSSVGITWSAVPGATSYRIYRGTTPGGESVYYTSAVASFTDTNGTSTGGTPLSVISVSTITPKPAGALYGAGDYISNLRWILERGSGGYACIYFPISMCTKWSMKGVDKKEAQISFEFEAVGDPTADLGVAPYLLEHRSALPTT